MELSEYSQMYTVEQHHWWFSARRMFFARIFRRVAIDIGTKRTIVDIGAGTGGMVSFLSQYGNVTGIEPNSLGRMLAKKRGIVLQKGSASDTGIKPNSCDIVSFFDVLYHQNINEVKSLAEAFRLLKPNGYLVVNDCAFAFLNSPHDRMVQGARRYTRSQLCTLIERAGFRVQYSTYSFFLLFPLFVAWRLFCAILSRLHVLTTDASDVGEVHPLFNRILIKLCWLESFGYQYGSYPWGSSVMVIAQKKAQ